MKALALGGVPATGKTTLMKSLISVLKPYADFRYGLLRGSLCKKCAILGVYEKGEMFAGTDRLSMAVQSDYEKFVKRDTHHILFEGDRLFTKKNLLSLVKTYDTKIIILEADEQTLKERHLTRNDTQKETFLKSRVTKTNNIKNEPALKGKIEVFTVLNEKDLFKVRDNICQWLNL
tara:strand:- start:371 stop:898 length:528 start_codon:yes stop_codon:yes gene_type:complete